MSKATKRVVHCKVCGAEYEACYSCERDRGWRMHTDTMEHYQILCVLMDYKTNRDAKGAYRALRKLGVDMQNSDGYVESVSKLLREIAGVRRENSNAENGSGAESETAQRKAAEKRAEAFAKSRKDTDKEG